MENSKCLMKTGFPIFYLAFTFTVYHKMKLQAELNNENHDVEIKRDGDKVFAQVDEREYES